MGTAELQRIISEEWLSRSQAASLLGKSAEWVRVLGDTGRVETIRTPIGKLYRREDVERIDQQNTQSQQRELATASAE